MPPVVGANDVAGLLEVAHEMREDERIAFGVTVDIREQVASELSGAHRRLQPPLHVVAREAREEDLRMPGARSQSSPALERVVFRSALEGEREQDALALQLGDEILERVPRSGIGPLQILEQEHEGPLLRGEAEKIGELLEQERLAPAARGLTARALERRVEQGNLPPEPRALHRKPPYTPQHFAPQRIRLREAMLVAACGHQRAAAQPHLGGERANERARAHSALANDGDHAAFATHRVFQVVGELRELLGASDEPGDIECVGARRECAGRVVAAGVEAGLTCGREQRRKRRAVLRCGRDAERERKAMAAIAAAR